MVKKKYDLVVVGSGPGGFSAAISAARQDLKVAIIEKNSFIGGTMQVGLNIHGFEDQKGERIIGGVSWELIQRCIKEDGALPPVSLQGAHMYSTTPVDLEILQKCAIDMIEESSVDVYLHTYALKPKLKNKKIKELICWSKNGENVFQANMFIDATGDADIAYRAGVDTVKGREKDGVMQPMSLLITLAPVNITSLVNNLGTAYGKAVKPGCKKESYTWFELDFRNWREELSEIGIELGKKGVFWGNSIRPNIANFNLVKVLNKDGTDNNDLSVAELNARKSVIKLINFLKRKFSYFHDSYLVRVAPFIGVRETRRIKGKYVISKNDAKNGLIPEDTIALCGYPIDIHKPEDGVAEFVNINKGRFGIPYRSLITEEIDNLLVSGRAISATHEAAGALRVMGTCLAIGEACGLASYLAKKQNKELNVIDGEILGDILKREKSMIF